MEQSKLDRINFLARKSRTQGLTDSEKTEQTELRNEYRKSVVQNLTSQLENTYIVDEKGNKHKVKKSGEKH